MCISIKSIISSKNQFAPPPPYCLIVALAVEERARQLQMRVPSYRPGSSTSFGHDPEAELKNRRDVSLKLAFRSPTHLSGSAGWIK